MNAITLNETFRSGQVPSNRHSAITDERQQYKVKYPLLDILLITLVGVICGADGWETIEEEGKNKLKLLKKYGFFHYGIPVHDTIARIISAIEPSQLQWKG